jgi:PAS domain S-box-containing protein
MSNTNTIQQEGNYKHMFLYNPTPMYIFDQETLEFLEVNDAAIMQYGYSREEFLQMTAKDIRPPEDVDALIKDVERTKGIVSYSGDWHHVKKNGELVLANIVSYPFTFKGRDARHVMATDVTEQRQMEQKVRESEERFRLIVETAPEPILIESEFKFAYVNSTAVKLFQAKAYTDLIGKLVLNFVHPVCREKVRKEIKKINEGEKSTEDIGELRFLTIDGVDIWVEIKGQQIEYEGKLATLMFIRDITDIRKATEAISYQEFLLKEMGNIAKIGGWEFDPETGEGTWTEEVARIHGMNPDDPTNVPLSLTFYTDESRIKVTNAINEAIYNKKGYNLELEMILQDGTHKWVHTFGEPVIKDGKVIRVRGAFQDVSERKMAEKALSESEQKYKAFFEHSLDALILSNPEGDLLEVNQATCKLLGYTEDELKKLKRKDIIDNSDSRLHNFIVRRLESGVAVGELRLKRKDGSLLDAEVSSALFMDASDNHKTSLIIRDISARKQSEKEIKELNAELEQRIDERTSQLRAANKDLEAFAYSVSHDLRAPLRGINGLTLILQDNYIDKLDEEGTRLCGRIRANSLKMGTLIEDLLSFSRASTSEIRKTSVNMNLLVEDALADLNEKEILSNIDFKIENLPPTEGDKSLLQQVWINLISNAVKFSSKKEKPVIEIRGHVLDGKSFYEIKDNGAGFNMEYAEKLFTAFQRLHSDKEFQGTGAGLAIVERILNKHGGRIWAESEEGSGATFSFCLPRKK